MAGPSPTVPLQLGADDPIESLQAVIEAELGIPIDQQVLMKDGKPLRIQSGRSISACGCASGDLIYVVKGRVSVAVMP